MGMGFPKGLLDSVTHQGYQIRCSETSILVFEKRLERAGLVTCLPMGQRLHRKWD